MDFFKKQWPHLAALAGLFLLACLYFSPAVFSGKALPQPDNEKARAMQTETQKYLKTTGEAPLWTNAAFGGMPAFQIYQPLPSNLTKGVFYTLLLGNGIAAPHTAIFLAMIGLYLLLIVCRVDWRIACFGAASFGLCVYNADILEAGHSTKMIALGLLPGIFAGAILCYRGQLLLGGGLAALFMSMEIYANHIQITYYSMMLVGILVVAKLIESLMHSGRLMTWAQGTATLGLALALGVGANAARILPTLEYSQETIRGKSELKEKAAKGDGLDKDYLFGWSYGVSESMTLLIPRWAGGGAGESIKGTQIGRKLGGDQRMVSRLMYTGDQPFVGTSIYFGAACLFLFMVGAFLVRGSEKWWLIGGALFMLSLAWGKNFFLNHLFYDYLPLFKKFRAVSMALGLAQMMVCILAALGLQELFDQDVSAEKKRKALLYGLAAVGGACLLAVFYSFIGSFDGANDARNFAQNQDMLPIVKADRSSLCRADALRSLGLVLAVFGVLWLFLKGILKSWIAVAVVFLLAIGDIWSVASRTLNASKYESARKVEAPPAPLAADQLIMKDKDPHFRVLDLVRGDMTTNYEPSFYHKNMSGYSAAKMALMQDVIEAHFSKNIQAALPIAGMLNAKWLIVGPKDKEPVAQLNPSALGNAWFVKKAVIVADADAELAALAGFNPRDTAIVQQKYADKLTGWQAATDSTDSIMLTSYHPDKMVYEYTAKAEQLCVFSEMFYAHEKGWNLYLNGQIAPNQIFKVNYLLRAARLPAGQKQVLEMRFEPKSVKTGSTVGYFCSALALLFCLAGLFFQFKMGGWSSPSQLSETKEKEVEKPISQAKKQK